MLQEFKEFIARGNVIDLAVAVVIGAAFGLVITSFTDDILMQIVAAIGGEPDFSSLSFTVNDAEIRYGAFITALVNFLIIAFALFLVVKAYNKMASLRATDTAQEEGADEVELLTQIRDALQARD